MQPRPPATLWTTAQRLFGLLRTFLTRLFFATQPAAHPQQTPVSAQAAAPQERIEFVTALNPVPSLRVSSNGQPHQPSIPSPDNGLGDGVDIFYSEDDGLGNGESDGDAEESVIPLPAANENAAAERPLLSTLESLLFVADAPVEPARLAQALRSSLAEVNAALTQLRAEYESHNRGMRLQERNGKVQLVTNPAAAQAVEEFLSLDLTTKLSGPALETLAIIAYRQPVTRTQIEAVRGVDCSGMVRKLEQQGLVEEVGRLETPGRPILYGVTDLFLQHFGLTHLEELPALPELDADSLRAVVALAEE